MRVCAVLVALSDLGGGGAAERRSHPQADRSVEACVTSPLGATMVLVFMIRSSPSLLRCGAPWRASSWPASGTPCSWREMNRIRNARQSLVATERLGDPAVVLGYSLSGRCIAAGLRLERPSRRRRPPCASEKRRAARDNLSPACLHGRSRS